MIRFPRRHECPDCGFRFWTTEPDPECRRVLCPLPIWLQVLAEAGTLLLFVALLTGWLP